MANWAVVASKIVLFDHPNPEVTNLKIGKVGPFQVVVGKDNGYKDGDLVVFAPERSVLPEDLRPHYINSQTGESYLSGPNKDRVKGIRLKGELSEGITIPLEYVKSKLGEIPIDEDISQQLGITKFEPPIPTQLHGVVTSIKESLPHFCKHDVEQLRIYQDQLIEGEEVIITEKIHGSQINIYKSCDTQNIYIASKGVAAAGNCLLETEDNSYWIAARNSGVLDRILSDFPKNASVQVFGEVIPVQSGYTYGQFKLTLRIFRLQVNGNFYDVKNLNEENADSFWTNLWVPEVYRGPLRMKDLSELSKRRESISGKSLHIAEGIVVSPYPMRRSRIGGFPLLLKVINPKYKSSDEDFS